jgi:hypothetical protein
LVQNPEGVMRYVAMSLAVLGLAVVVTGQDRQVSPKADAIAIQEDILGRLIPAALSDGQAATLRVGVAKAKEGVAALTAAAEEFRKGGDDHAAGQMLKLAESARAVGGGVAEGLVLREKGLTEKVAKLEAEIATMQAEAARLKEELRQTQEGKPDPDFE